jgi:uncharacterized repeat protein (TIGR01451 family)
MVALLLASLRASARQVFDPADPGFAGAVSVLLPPVPLGPLDKIMEFTSNGVTFRFESLSSQPLKPSRGDGIASWSFGSNQGVAVTISPPVQAIAFVGTGIDGCPGGIFVGSSATEVIELTSPCNLSRFYGAADIGAIGVVGLEAENSGFRVIEMLFVPSTPPTTESDLSLAKDESRGPSGRALNGELLEYDLTVVNQGPDTAENVQLNDFLPPDVPFSSASGGGAHDPLANVVSWRPGNLSNGDSRVFDLDAMTPDSAEAFSCESALVNVAVVGSDSADPSLSDNLRTETTLFDRAAVSGELEICGDGIDNNCDGRVDCGDPASCNCQPTLPPGAGGNPSCFVGLIEAVPGEPPVLVETCTAGQNEASQHACQVPRGRCGGVTLPAYCCDPARWSDASLSNLQALQACDVGVPGCTPVDPNFKESDPPVNIAGYGFTAAGRTMTYTIHYENVGDADALDVKVIDVLDPDLNDATLVIRNGGVYDAASRTLVWTDPVLPPSEPRFVSFDVNVRADAEPGTRVRNVGTIVFPNAEPPSRIDTEFVEHVVPDPRFPIEPAFRIRGCAPIAVGSWRVELVNDGVGFAYDVIARIVDTSPAISLAQPNASFAHPNDLSPNLLATVIPNATTTSTDVVEFLTPTPADPCPTFDWLIEWENLRGERTETLVLGVLDGDDDAVADEEDNCPAAFNPDQADGDGDGIGDACDASGPSACDVDGDFDVDRNDVNLILAARNTAASGPDDPRDRDGDGRITVLDSRKCVLECTRPGCATN